MRALFVDDVINSATSDTFKYRTISIIRLGKSRLVEGMEKFYSRSSSKGTTDTSK